MRTLGATFLVFIAAWLLLGVVVVVVGEVGGVEIMVWWVLLVIAEVITYRKTRRRTS